jgi:hypothetical protein
MNRAPTNVWSNSHAGIPRISAGASAPTGPPALTSTTATHRPTTTTRVRPVVGDTPLLILRRQK